MVAYDIHDGLIQMIVGVRFQLSNYAAHRRTAPSEAEGELQKGLDQLGAAIAEARRVIEGLRPFALDELGLVTTLQEFAQGLAEDSGWDLEFQVSPPDLRAPTAIETTAFRIAQEALTNARKYAEADRVLVRISAENGHLSVEVRDWGRGFDPASVLARRESVGLAGIRERARLLGGHCTIESEPGRGASIQAVLPMRGEVGAGD